jgi:hypothetical protein
MMQIAALRSRLEKRPADLRQNTCYFEWREDKKRLGRFIAPKGLQDLAQGFNPGNHPMKPFALKGRELTWANPAPYRSRE